MRQNGWGWIVLLGAATGCGDGSPASTPARSDSIKLSSPAQFQDIGSATGDLNGDGYLDLAVLTAPTDPGDTRSAYVTVYYGPIGEGSSLRVSEHYDTVPSASAIALADVDGDGTLDIVIAQRCASGPGGHFLGRVQVYFRAAPGGVAGEAEAFLGLDAVAVNVADVDGDGIPDLMAAGAGYLYVSRGLGARTFDAPTHVATSGVWALRKSAGSGGVDLAVARWTEPCIVDLFRWNNGLRGLEAVTSVDFGCIVTTLIASDLDGDGKDDLIAGTADGAQGSVSIASSHGASRFTLPVQKWTGPVRGIIVGDFDGDGRRDLGVTRFDANGSVLFLMGSADGMFQSGRTLVPSARGLLRTAADLDGDGKSDLLLCSPSVEVVFSPCRDQD